MIDRPLAERSSLRLRPDASRVIAMLFVAGQEVVGGSESRASAVVDRVLALDEVDVRFRLDDLMRRFGHRHRSLTSTFEENAARIGNRLEPGRTLSRERRLLLGATFTHEFSVESASLCNPSMVAHPDQTGVPVGELRFVMSVRAIGEGHRSSIGFRSGIVAADGAVSIDEPAPFPTVGTIQPGICRRDVFQARLGMVGRDGESASFVLGALGETFSFAELAKELELLESQFDTRSNALATATRLRAIAARSYDVSFPPVSQLSERVLWPATAAEANGMEDARFVRFVDDDGRVTFYATYTAFDGVGITQQLLETNDFVTFSASPLVGPAATNKGLAIFPRRVGGQFAALSRFDRESNAVAYTSSIGQWEDATTVQSPVCDWEVVQLGNCGPPIETERGWLVLTHGVGPMRTYSIGALLLDLDDPRKVVATLAEPLLTPEADEQDGYVPNVVYSCGTLVHNGILVIPYGVADTAIGFARVEVKRLLDAMTYGPSGEGE